MNRWTAHLSSTHVTTVRTFTACKARHSRCCQSLTECNFRKAARVHERTWSRVSLFARLVGCQFGGWEWICRWLANLDNWRLAQSCLLSGASISSTVRMLIEIIVGSTSNQYLAFNGLRTSTTSVTCVTLFNSPQILFWITIINLERLQFRSSHFFYDFRLVTCIFLGSLVPRSRIMGLCIPCHRITFPCTHHQ